MAIRYRTLPLFLPVAALAFILLIGCSRETANNTAKPEQAPRYQLPSKRALYLKQQSNLLDSDRKIAVARAIVVGLKDQYVPSPKWTAPMLGMQER
jgi:hypothetical protein